MQEIIIKRCKAERKPKRSSVVVSPETYIRVYTLAQDVGMPMEKLVDLLLREALDQVKVED